MTYIAQARIEQILPIVEVEDGIVRDLVFGVVVSRWKPNAEESSITKETAAEFMQSEVARGSFDANYLWVQARAVFSFLGFFHRDGRAFLEYNGR